MDRTTWWRGARGEWYVVVQVAFFVLIAIGPRTLWGWPPWPFPDNGLIRAAGWVMAAGGACLMAAGGAKVGAKLTPLPYPAQGGVLQETGAFRVVRHPMYCGGVFAAFGWALLSHGWLTLAYSALLFVFLDCKARREEGWLCERFSTYKEYQRRVRKLVPFVY